jgi:hypothetical protein
MNGVQYRYQAPRFQAPAVRPPQQLGKVSDLGFVDWAMLGGGAIVAGAGLNTVVGALPSKKKKLNLVSLVVGSAITLVGGTAFVQNFQKLVS